MTLCCATTYDSREIATKGRVFKNFGRATLVARPPTTHERLQLNEQISSGNSTVRCATTYDSREIATGFAPDVDVGTRVLRDHLRLTRDCNLVLCYNDWFSKRCATTYDSREIAARSWPKIRVRKTFLGQRNRGFQPCSAAKAWLETTVTSQLQSFFLRPNAHKAQVISG